MKIIITMAGIGERFIKAGYDKPKPFIVVNGKKIIDYIIDLFDEKDEFILIANNKVNVEEVLSKNDKNIKIVYIDSHKKGPVFTVKHVFDQIKDDEEIIVTYCDNPYRWNYKDFKKNVKKKKLDGCILSHIGLHPHALNSTKMAFMKVDNEKVLEIKEKECYTDNHLKEHASTGTYYFAKGIYVKKYFNELMEKNINYNNEYYVTLVYNLMIKNNLNVGYYDTKFVTVFGTPEEVQSFEAWKVILNSGQVKNEKDLLRIYRYWKKYHNG